MGGVSGGGGRTAAAGLLLQQQLQLLRRRRRLRRRGRGGEAQRTVARPRRGGLELVQPGGGRGAGGAARGQGRE